MNNKAKVMTGFTFGVSFAFFVAACAAGMPLAGAFIFVGIGFGLAGSMGFLVTDWRR